MKTLFYEHLAREVADLGGMLNAHLHLDRAGTADPAYWPSDSVDSLSGLPLSAKHAMIPTLHASAAYDPPELARRVNRYIDMMTSVGTTRADTVVDVTCDRVGLSAIETMQRIKQQRRAEIDLRLGVYSPLGYSDDDPQRWALLEQGLAFADFIGSLPEADDRRRYPDRIGFDVHLERMLELGQKAAKPIHIHLDQRNEASEDGTERLVAAIRRVGSLELPSGEPSVWAVHVISPSRYEEARFQALLQAIAECNIGIICCPSAALGMRQLRPLLSPTYNSIARVLELLAAGIPVRLGNDNIDDICSPSTSADLTDEVMILSAALRFYDVPILARLAAGKPLTETQILQVREHLSSDHAAISRILGELSP